MLINSRISLPLCQQFSPDSHYIIMTVARPSNLCPLNIEQSVDVQVVSGLAPASNLKKQRYLVSWRQARPMVSRHISKDIPGSKKEKCHAKELNELNHKQQYLERSISTEVHKRKIDCFPPMGK